MVEHFCVKFNVPSYSGFLRYRVEKTDAQTVKCRL